MPRKRSPALTISRLAAITEVGVETVRFYQRRGLLETPQNTGGYRVYGPDHVQRIRFIRQAQSLGFSLGDIAGLLLLDEEKDHQIARALAREKIADIETRVGQLQSMANALRHLVSACEHVGIMPCPIIRMSLGDTAPD